MLSVHRRSKLETVAAPSVLAHCQLRCHACALGRWAATTSTVCGAQAPTTDPMRDGVAPSALVVIDPVATASNERGGRRAQASDPRRSIACVPRRRVRDRTHTASSPARKREMIGVPDWVFSDVLQAWDWPWSGPHVLASWRCVPIVLVRAGIGEWRGAERLSARRRTNDAMFWLWRAQNSRGDDKNARSCVGHTAHLQSVSNSGRADVETVATCARKKHITAVSVGQNFAIVINVSCGFAHSANCLLTVFLRQPEGATVSVSPEGSRTRRYSRARTAMWGAWWKCLRSLMKMGVPRSMFTWSLRA